MYSLVRCLLLVSAVRVRVRDRVHMRARPRVRAVVSSIYLTFLKIGRTVRAAITNPFGDDT